MVIRVSLERSKVKQLELRTTKFPCNYFLFVIKLAKFISLNNIYAFIQARSGIFTGLFGNERTLIIAKTLKSALECVLYTFNSHPMGFVDGATNQKRSSL